MRARKIPLFLAAAAASALATPVATAPPASATEINGGCSVHRLSVPGAALESDVDVGDQSGHWLAGTITTSDGTQAVRWHDSVRSMLTLPVDTPMITGINGRGDVVGQAIGGAHLTSFAVVNGTYTELTAPDSGADQVAATGISNGGIVSGYLYFGDKPDAAVEWDVTAPNDPRIIDVPAGFYGLAKTVNAHGEIALDATKGRHRSRAYVVTTAGVHRSLRPTDAKLQAVVDPIAVGWAAGWEQDPATGVGHVVRWDLKDHRSGTAISSTFAVVLAVNGHGEIGGQLVDGRAALITGTTTKALPGLPGASEGEVTVIADDGVAAGSAIDPDGHLTAVTWTC